MKNTGIVLLAAGNSVRYQGIKLLEEISGKKMYLHILEKVKDLPFYPKVLVTQYEEIAERAEKDGFQIVWNKRPQEGLSLSVRLGIEAVLSKDAKTEAILFGVCDQPYIKQETIINLCNVFWQSEKGIASAAYGEISGNPCIFDKKYFKELLLLEGDCGGKEIIKKYADDVHYMQVDQKKELEDIDTRKD